MKIRIDIDCTALEARSFLGLPDVGPMQAALLDEVRKRLSANLAAMEPETLAKTWLPLTLQGFERLQQDFWSAMQRAADSPRTDPKTEKKK